MGCIAGPVCLLVIALEHHKQGVLQEYIADTVVLGDLPTQYPRSVAKDIEWN